MFRIAYDVAKDFTFPVIISTRSVDGKTLSGSIGSFVVVNDEGWIVTCWHVADALLKGQASEQKARQIEAQIDVINADASLSAKEKTKRISNIPKMRNNEIGRASALWAVTSQSKAQVHKFHACPAVDLVVGKLEPFDPTSVTRFPKLKDPSKDFEPGVGLCKLGYPFHEIKPNWDHTVGAFILPPGALPVPRFPIDGILTRLINVDVTNGPPGPAPFPLQMFETSTPGLRGQSGGSVVDQQGSLWGIQSNTAHFPLGFDPIVPNSNNKTEYQFLNVGRCIHTSSIVGLLQMTGVKFDRCGY